MKKYSVASALVAAVALCGAGAAQAQQAGQVLVTVGWNSNSVWSHKWFHLRQSLMTDVVTPNNRYSTHECDIDIMR